MDPMGYAQVFQPHYDSLFEICGQNYTARGAAGRPRGGRAQQNRKSDWLEDRNGVSNFNSNSKYIYINISKKFGEHRKTPQINSVGQFRFDIKASICKGNIFCRRNIHLPVIG
jgi:hypothetical protein